MVVTHINNCNLREIMTSGQIFRMYELSAGHFVVFSGKRRLCIIAGGDEQRFLCNEEEFSEYWENYFDLKRDYGKIIESITAGNSCGKNDFLVRSALCCSGIRVLDQELFEMLITFIISQQKQIPAIRKCVEALCERFGDKKEVPQNEFSDTGFYYTFPEPEKISAAGPEGLKGLSLGYRERYIYESAVKFALERPSKESLQQLGFEQAKNYLKSFTGVGEKVADCVCLFGLHFTSAFPIDTHVKDILYREFYDGDKSFEAMTPADYNAITETAFGPFAEEKGILQQWMFAYEIGKKE